MPTSALCTTNRISIGGIIGNVWLEQIPEPAARQSLAGDWNGIALPGRTTMLLDQVRREFTPNAAMRGKRAVLYIETREDIVHGIILNDRFINRDFAGMHFLMSRNEIPRYLQFVLVTPFIYPQT